MSLTKGTGGEDGWPEVIYHGTDALSAAIIQKVGFKDVDPHFRTTRAEPGYVYGTTESGWAQVYAERRAVQFGTVDGVILEIDVRGLPVEMDTSVALDSLMGIAFRVPLPVGPERVKEFRRVPSVRGRCLTHGDDCWARVEVGDAVSGSMDALARSGRTPTPAEPHRLVPLAEQMRDAFLSFKANPTLDTGTAFLTARQELEAEIRRVVRDSRSIVATPRESSV